MLRQELQKYFDKVYPKSKVELEETIFGQVHIRFELGGTLKNGTKERVNQATERALSLFIDTFENPNTEIWVLIYEFLGPNIFNVSDSYLNNQFLIATSSSFYSSQEKEDLKIIIRKLPVKAINIQNILRGIANCEMGFDPRIGATVIFIDPLTDRAFQMYDDRGCFIWSDDAAKIRDIYKKHYDWIVQYHKPEIDKYFN